MNETANKEQMYIIRWRSKVTENEGHGEPLSKEMAEEWVKFANKHFPDITHWYEPVKEGRE